MSGSCDTATPRWPEISPSVFLIPCPRQPRSAKFRGMISPMIRYTSKRLDRPLLFCFQHLFHYFLGPGHGGHGLRKAYRRNKQQQGVGNLLRTCSRLQRPASMRTYRSFRLSGGGCRQLDQMRGLLVEGAGRAQGCSECLNGTDDLREFLTDFFVKRWFAFIRHGSLLVKVITAFCGLGCLERNGRIPAT